jgi:hypothetical protein
VSAAAQRAELAALGRDLMALRGTAGERRAAALLTPCPDTPPSRFADLLRAPEWLRWPRAAQEQLAQVVALRSVAPALAGSINGAWLGALAKAAGEDAVDWAIAAGMDRAQAEGQPVAPGELAARGFAILRAALPPGLRAYLVGVPISGPASAEPEIVAEALAFVAAREAAA